MSSKTTTIAAIDLGATSGRVIVGEFSPGTGLKLTEVHRFPNAFYSIGPHDYWNVGGLWEEVTTGLKKAAKAFPGLASCGVDTWGVDHVLLDKSGRLAFPVHAYRDQRTEPLLEKLKSSGDDRRIYEWTGIPPLSYNTAIQLAETLQSFPHLREAVDRVLLLPDYFNYLLSGTMRNEVSIASTGQLMRLDRPEFSTETFDYFGIPGKWFEGPALAGERLGPVCGIPGLEKVQTILVPGHDTADAFESIPKIGEDLYISAGTWLLVGGLTAKPAAGKEGYDLKVSNERDGRGGYRPNRILLGLWLLEQTIPDFSMRPQNDSDWEELIQSAETKKPYDKLIDLNDSALFNPDNMRKAIDANIERQGGRIPTTLAGYMRLICESLGQAIADTTNRFAAMTGKPFDNIIMVGGGSKNRLLCQQAANHSGLTVTSNEMEGSAIGNMGYQLMGLGVVNSMEEFRQAIAPGIKKTVYRPKG